MTPEQVGARLAGLLTGAVATRGEGGPFARAGVTVPPDGWLDAVRTARDDGELGCDFFDWLGGVDEQDEQDRGYAVVAHLWSTAHRHGVLLRAELPRSAPVLASVVGVYPGAAWYERETHEMFGIDFTGHPGGLRPLLLSAQFEGYPLRKDFILASRVAKPWPGAKEPGEPAGTARRPPPRPPGVPAPGQWGT